MEEPVTEQVFSWNEMSARFHLAQSGVIEVDVFGTLALRNFVTGEDMGTPVDITFRCGPGMSAKTMNDVSHAWRGNREAAARAVWHLVFEWLGFVGPPTLSTV